MMLEEGTKRSSNAAVEAKGFEERRYQNQKRAKTRLVGNLHNTKTFLARIRKYVSSGARKPVKIINQTIRNVRAREAKKP